MTQAQIPIGGGQLSMARRYESLKRIDSNFTLDTLNGTLSSFVAPGSQGYIAADFTTRRPSGSPPRTTVGKITIIDGQDQVILNVPNATIQIEAGPKEGDWQTIASFFASGVATDGRPFVFRSISAESNDTSLVVGFGIAGTNDILQGLSAISAALKPA